MGFKIDWVAFTQFHDSTLEKFLRDPKAAGGQFMVQLRRSHYFGTEVPDIDQLISFRVQSPVAPYADAYAFVRKDDPDGVEAIEKYRWSSSYRPVVQLKWREGAEGENPRIEIARVVRNSWRR